MSRPTCYLDDCGLPHHAQGLCTSHYNRQRKAALKNGTWEPVQVDAGSFKERLKKFLDLGYNYSMLQVLTGTDRSTMLRAVNDDKKTVIAENVKRLERVPLTPLYELWRTDIGVDYKVPSYLASRRIRALMAKGYTTTTLGEETGLGRKTVARLAHQEVSETVFRSSLVRIAEAYDRLWDQEPPTPYHRSNLTRYSHWPLPIEWDDEELDHPDAEGEVLRRSETRRKTQHKNEYMRKYSARKRALSA